MTVTSDPVPDSVQRLDMFNVDKQCAYLDIEVNQRNEIYQVGIATLRQQRTYSPQNFDEFSGFLESIKAARPFLCGHNFRRFDKPRMEQLWSELKKWEKVVIDTLELSHLVEPLKLSHRLPKQYKTSRFTTNDPLADVLATRELLRNIVTSFAEIEVGLRTWMLWLITSGATNPAQAYYKFFHEVGYELSSQAPDIAILSMEQRRRINVGELKALQRNPAKWNFDERLSAAYILAWNAARQTNLDVIHPVAPWIMHLKGFEQVSRKLCGASFDLPPAATFLREFGLTDFRPSQKAAIDAILAGQNPLLLLPTGGGKSLCYQLPALLLARHLGRLTVVISPLQALMIDQVHDLKSKDAEFATFINGTLSAEDRSERVVKLREGHFTLLYISPEQLRSASMRTLLEERPPILWVVDEAHCISQWGHDFRTDYCYIPRFLDEIYRQQGFPLPSVAFVTATATSEVQADIREIFQRYHITIGDVIAPPTLERPNLQFAVTLATEREKIDHIEAAVRKALQDGGSAIIYTTSRIGTQKIAEELRQRGIECCHFHAKIPHFEKQNILDAFKTGKLRVVVATTAFGMGINRADVRVVIHHRMSANLEGYIQESGRAGRDGLAARCLLLFEGSDGEKVFRLQARNQLSEQDLVTAYQSMCSLRDRFRRGTGYLWVMAHDIVRGNLDPFDGEDEQEQRETKAQIIIQYLEQFGLITHQSSRMALLNFHISQPTVEAAFVIFANYAQKHHIPAASTTRFQTLIALLYKIAKARRTPDEPYPLDLLSTQSGIAIEDIAKFIMELSRAGVCSDETPCSFHLHVADDVQPEQQLAHVEALLQAIDAIIYEQSQNNGIARINMSALATRTEKLVPQQRGLTRISVKNLMPLIRYLRNTGWGKIVKVNKDTLEIIGWSKGGARHDILSYFAPLRIVLLTLYAIATKDSEDNSSVSVAARLAGATPKQIIINPQLTMTLEALLVQLHNKTAYQTFEVNDLEQHLRSLRRLGFLTITDGPALMEKAYQVAILPDATVATIEQHYPHLIQHYAQQTRRTHIMLQYCSLTSPEARATLVSDYFAHKVQEFDACHPELPTVYQPLTDEDNRFIIDTLNAMQHEVVTATEPAMLVLAGPGSGKTRTIVHRIAYLIKALRVEPQRIVALAFNRNAADELRQRLHDLVGIDAYRVQISTFHSLALRLLGRAVDDEQRDDDWDRVIERACTLFTVPIGSSSAELFTQRAQILGDIEYVFVDEYQDVNASMYQLIQCITEKDLMARKMPAPHVNICVIGDDDQSIYGFMGANPEYLLHFEEDYQAKRYPLTDNYRSTHAIVSAANAYISNNRERAKQQLREQVSAARPEENSDPVRTLIFANEAALALSVAQQVQQWIHNGDRPEDICLVAHMWENLDFIRALLMRAETSTKELRSHIELSKCMLTVRLRRYLKNDHDHIFGPEESVEAVFHEFFQSIGHGVTEPTVAQLVTVARRLDEQRDSDGDETQQHLPIAIDDVLIALKEYDKNIVQRIAGSVAVSTMHSVKGLEFKRVIAIIDQSHRFARSDVEEQRRLIYVAMTRAKDTLILCSTDNSQVYHEAGLLPETMDIQQEDSSYGIFFRSMGPGDVYLSDGATKSQQSNIESLKEGEPLRINLNAAFQNAPILLPNGKPIGSLAKIQSKKLRECFGQDCKELSGDVVSVYKIYRHIKIDNLTDEVKEAHFVVIPEIKYVTQHEPL